MTIPKKTLGQHWLHDLPTLEAMCNSAGVTTGDRVLEIGPGTGELTAQLLKHGARVLALEFDQELIPQLQKSFSQTELKLEQGDIRTFDLASLPLPYKIVANIPYYLTANLLRKLVDDNHKPAIAALLVQKEVAQRVAARPGKMSFISVAAQSFYEVNLGEIVPAYLFTPPPKVDSQILILTLRTKPLFEVDWPKFLRIVKAGFNQPRKKLTANLSGGLQIAKPKIANLLQKLQINSKSRAQELSLEDWHNIYNEINNEINNFPTINA